jgi:hypothetical protein
MAQVEGWPVNPAITRATAAHPRAGNAVRLYRQQGKLEAGMSEWIWIPLGIAAAIWFFSILEGWSDIGPIDHDDTPEDP